MDMIEDDLISRAANDYRQTGGTGGTDEPGQHSSVTRDRDGDYRVKLANVNGTLAEYLYRLKSDRLYRID